MGWSRIAEDGAKDGTEWEFVPAGCQFRNGLAESRVKAVKSTLKHVMESTLIGSKPTLHYAELCTLLAQCANIVNDRPISIRTLTGGYYTVDCQSANLGQIFNCHTNLSS